MFDHPDNWIWLWLIAAAALIGIAGEIWRRRALGRFGGPNVIAAAPRTWFVLSGELLAMLLLVGALADPRWGFRVEQVPESQVQLVFAVDVSRSMSAADVAPSRLEAARAIVTQCLKQLDSERIALVDFAGSARIAAPLTRNYAEIEAKLAALRPSERLIGGSEIKNAVQAGCDAFLHRMASDKVLVLLSDGEDHGSDDAAGIAAIATACGCRMLIVGLGDPVAGSKIVIGQTASGPEYLTYQGETVISRRNDALLEQLALLTGGFYMPATSADVDLGAIYRERIASTFSNARRERQMRVGVARFPWFLAGALVALLSAGWLAHGARRPHWRTANAPQVLAAMLLLAVGLGASPDDLIRAANRHFRAGRWDNALAGYQRAATLNPESAVPIFNRAMTQYRSGERDGARRTLKEMNVPDDWFAARRAFLLGNCDYADVVDGGLSKADSIARLQRAIGNYRGALGAEPDWKDPRINIELAQMLIEEIKHAPESGQNSQKPSDEGKTGGQQNNNSPPEGAGQNRQSPPQPPNNGAKGQQPGSPPPGGNGKSGGQQPKSPSDKAGGSQGPGQGSGQQSRSQQPDNSKPNPDDTQKKLEKILQQSRQREAERKADAAGKGARVDKDW